MNFFSPISVFRTFWVLTVGVFFFVNFCFLCFFFGLFLFSCFFFVIPLECIFYSFSLFDHGMVLNKKTCSEKQPRVTEGCLLSGGLSGSPQTLQFEA